MSLPNPCRLPHAVLDLESRHHKGVKIERLLGLTRSDKPIKVLEIGCGSGGISHYFARHPHLQCEVEAVDVHDARMIEDGYRFTLVQGAHLPFADATFDVVISNHVVEHVGPRVSQEKHLQEMRRVMKPDAIAYLAVPNRWMIVEPHYRLIFLSWLPRAWRTPYLRLTGKGKDYDCEPLTLGAAESLFEQAALSPTNVCIEALHLTVAIEGRAGLARLFDALPDALTRLLLPVFPTLCFVVRSART